MISFNINKNTIAPKEIGAKVGNFYEMPNEETLNDVQTNIYGEIYNQPEGFIDWLFRTNPKILPALLAGANFAKDVREEGEKSLSKISNAIVLGSGAIVLVLIALRLSKK